MVPIEEHFWCDTWLWRISTVIDWQSTHSVSEWWLGCMVMYLMFAIRATTNYDVVDRAFNQLQCSAVLTRSIFSHTTSQQLRMSHTSPRRSDSPSHYLNQCWFIIYRRFLVVASQSGFMPTGRPQCRQQALAAGITQKSQLTTAQSLLYPIYWVIIYQLTLWYLHDRYYLICNPWKYPQSFPMPSALSAILYLFLGGSLWLEWKRRWIRRSSMEQDMWLAVASTWQFDPISERSCDWLNNLGHSNMEVLVGF